MEDLKRNLHNIPVDIFVCIMKKLIAVGGTEDFYHAFVAWSQTQRPPVIISFLASYPIEELYKFSFSKRPIDVEYFYRFLGVAARLDVPAGRCFIPCKNLICGVGNIDMQLDVLLHLSNRGHFLSRLAWYVFQTFYHPNINNGGAALVADLCRNPQHRKQVIPTLVYLKDILSNEVVTSVLEAGASAMVCEIHNDAKKSPPSAEPKTLGECMT